MAGVMNKVPYSETNNHKQGKTGSGPRANTKVGPATGRKGHVNPTKSGGINRATKGKM